MVLQRTLIAVVGMMLSACSTTFWYTPTPHQVAFEDLNHFKWDCPHAPEQVAWLQQQFATTTPFPADAARRAIIYKNLNEIKTYCPNVTKSVGCVHVREDFARGSSQATVCNSSRGLGPVERPTVNRWDPLVDMK